MLTVSRPALVGDEGTVQVRRILCGVSGAEHSVTTVACAARLAAAAGSHLTLLHVREPGQRAAELPVRGEEIPVPFEHRVVPGFPAAEIVHAAREDGADVVVVGRHDGTASVLRFPGSTCSRLVQAAPCAVVSVPPALPAQMARRSA